MWGWPGVEAWDQHPEDVAEKKLAIGEDYKLTPSMHR